MYDSILFPTDGRAGTERAMVRALDLARTFDATLHALYVADTEATPETLPDEERQTVQERLTERGEATTLDVQNRADKSDIEVVRHTREGRPYRAIVEYVEEQEIDQVVMGVRGRADADVSHLGSTTQRVLTHTDVPVLTVPLDGPEALPETGHSMYDRVVIPIDGSDAAERAAASALTIAERYGADVRVVYVVDTNTYGFEDAPRSIVGLLREGGENAVETVAVDAREANLQASTAILRGVPEDAILQYTEGAGADLIAMGTRGQTGGNERLLGSTTARVVRRSSVPVLTLR